MRTILVFWLALLGTSTAGAISVGGEAGEKAKQASRHPRDFSARAVAGSEPVPILSPATAELDMSDPTIALPAAPRGALGFPSRDADLDALPGFQNPPPGYGQVPFWWWTGDPLDKERLRWQIEQLHAQGISGMQVNYAHEDSPGWPTYAAEPEIFSEAWWDVWKYVAGECSKREMGIGLSGYTLDWPNGRSLISRMIYSDPEIQGREITIAGKHRLAAGQTLARELPADTIAVRAYAVGPEAGASGPRDLAAEIREERLEWTPAAGDWEVWIFTAPRKPGTLNPIHSLAGQRVIERFFQPFQDHAPDRSAAGLNYFFHDELQFGVGDRIWVDDLPAEFQRRKGYDLFQALPALFQDVGPRTVKYRLDFMDVKMQLAQQRYFVPIFQWHWNRGKIYGCDQGSRGRNPLEFGDYFSAVRWYTAPGHDTPGGSADLIKGKVSSSIAQLYRRPRVWLEGYHSLGWGATPERLMFATRENYLYGCNLLNLHGLYYTTHGSFWEWAPPCYHFRMPYWQHMGEFFKYFERLSYLMSQGAHVCDVAVMYPVAPGQAGLGGSEAPSAAFAAGTTLMQQGYDFIFMDDESLARAEIRDGRLHISEASYRVLVLPAMRAVRWSTLEKAARFFRAGGIVVGGGSLPEASDRVGAEDAELDALVRELFGATAAEFRAGARPPLQTNDGGGVGIALPQGGAAGDVWSSLVARLEPLVLRDVGGDPPVKAMHRQVGPRDVYLVMSAAKDSAIEFRARGRAELWDPWTGAVRPLRVLGETAATTTVAMPLEDYEAQVIVFTPGEPPAAAPSASPAKPSTAMRLDGEWEFELEPTMDNRFGDFRLPATDSVIGPEARVFRHAIEAGDTDAWTSPAFDDRSWDRVTYDFGPQFWLLGPLAADGVADGLDARLAKLGRVDPREPIDVAGQLHRWRPYRFSWRQGLEGDPGHQGWHGLKKHISDHFLCLGKRENALNEFKYVPEAAGSRYYLWTSATVARATVARIATSQQREGERPHASEVLAPAAVYVNGARVEDLEQAVALQAGANPVLVRYDRAGRGYFVLNRQATQPPRPERSPLSMRWFDDPTVIRFDVHAGGNPAEWFRFTAPPGLRAMTITARGGVEAWADGQPLRKASQGRFETSCPLPRAASVALRVRPETGFCGAAVFPQPIRLECGPGLAAPGDWSQAGTLECYSGGAWYRRTVTLTADQAAGPCSLDLGKVVATAEVRVNGQRAGIRVAPPWRMDISPQIKPGENRIEILVYNTLANHYLTIPTRYRGDLTSGLLGPVTLSVTTIGKEEKEARK